MEFVTVTDSTEAIAGAGCANANARELGWGGNRSTAGDALVDAWGAVCAAGPWTETQCAPPRADTPKPSPNATALTKVNVTVAVPIPTEPVTAAPAESDGAIAASATAAEDAPSNAPDATPPDGNGLGAGAVINPTSAETVQSTGLSTDPSGLGVSTFGVASADLGG